MEPKFIQPESNIDKIISSVEISYETLKAGLNPNVFSEISGFDYALFSSIASDTSQSIGLRYFYLKLSNFLYESRKNIADDNLGKIFDSGVLLFKTYRFHPVDCENERNSFYRNRLYAPSRYYMDPKSVQEDIESFSKMDPATVSFFDIDRSTLFDGIDLSIKSTEEISS